MSNKIFLKQLEHMKGKTFQYGNQIHCLNDYRIDEQNEKVILTTNLKTFSRPYDAIDEFLKFWEPVNSVANTSEHDNAIAIYSEQENNLMDSLIETLKSNIDKVKNNKEYIPQATSINNNVNSIVNITKMKLEMFKQMKNLSGRNKRS